ncbi:hypothetical protein MHU86_13085 [Fragilaria crotonensis]|nr:hypothetical protein MHU86_13085 [Fragilaria crotonensis]
MALSPRTHWIQEDPVLVENWSLESNGSKSPTSFRSLQADEPSSVQLASTASSIDVLSLVQRRQPSFATERTSSRPTTSFPGIESLSITSSAAREDDFYLRWKTKADEMYTGGCIFVDHASGFVHVELQVNLNTHETLKAKEKFELTCRQYGVVPQEYLADNSKIFTSAEYTRNLSTFSQIMRFAGVGAHHHNGIAERNIRTIMAIARTMMLHAAIHWPSIADATLWPLAVNHAVFLVNHVPDPRTGLCPADLFTKTRWEQRKLNNLHVWGCPVYVLDKMISDGKKLPRWTPRSTRTINMGFSPKHAITVPIVL